MSNPPIASRNSNSTLSGPAKLPKSDVLNQTSTTQTSIRDNPTSDHRGIQLLQDIANGDTKTPWISSQTRNPFRLALLRAMLKEYVSSPINPKELDPNVIQSKGPLSKHDIDLIKMIQKELYDHLKIAKRQPTASKLNSLFASTKLQFSEDSIDGVIGPDTAKLLAIYLKEVDNLRQIDIQGREGKNKKLTS